MPQLSVVPNLERAGFDALRDISDPDDPRVIHLGNDVPLEIGALEFATREGRAAVEFCFPLPDGRVVLASTTLRLFLAAAHVLAKRYAESPVVPPDGPSDRG